VGNVVATYNRAARAISAIDERVGTLKEQAARAATAINPLAGKISPELANILPTSALAPNLTPMAEAVKPFPQLLIRHPTQTILHPGVHSVWR